MYIVLFVHETCHTCHSYPYIYLYILESIRSDLALSVTVLAYRLFRVHFYLTGNLMY